MKHLEVTVLNHETQSPEPHVPFNGITYSCYHNIQHVDWEHSKVSYEKFPFENDHTAYYLKIREKVLNKEK
jgi:hypothetical protein